MTGGGGKGTGVGVVGGQVKRPAASIAAMRKDQREGTVELFMAGALTRLTQIPKILAYEFQRHPFLHNKGRSGSHPPL
jgi:hypothetical protein